MGFALRLAVVAVVLAAAVYWPRLFDKTYKVHTAGNVLVTGTSSGIGRRHRADGREGGGGGGRKRER